jgi:hypothetical protein
MQLLLKASEIQCLSAKQQLGLRRVTDLPWAQKADGHRKKLNFVFF